MAEKARHAFGNSENLQNAIDTGVIDSYDILFLDGETDPKVGWIDRDGNTVIVKSTATLEGQVANLETEMSNKISTTEAETKINEVVTEKVNTVVSEQVETIVSEKVETVVNNKIEDKIDASMDEKVQEAVNSANSYAKSYTDEKIAEILDASSDAVVEF